MYPLLATFLLLHGLAHLVGFVGFVGPWGLSNSVPQSKIGIPVNVAIIVTMLLSHPEVAAT